MVTKKPAKKLKLYPIFDFKLVWYWQIHWSFEKGDGKNILFIPNSDDAKNITNILWYYWWRKTISSKNRCSGNKKNEIKLNVTKNSLEISGEHKEEHKEKKKNYLTKERSQVSYYRTLPISENIVASKVKAKLNDGVLDITLPKSKPTRPKRRNQLSSIVVFSQPLEIDIFLFLFCF